MSNLWNGMSDTMNMTETENGAETLKSTESAVLDLFSMGGALRTREPAKIEQMVSLALSEDKALAIKCLFYLRDVRGGQGERRTFRESLKILSNYYPEDAVKVMKLIPEYGRWDDLFYLDNIDISEILNTQIGIDLACVNPSLLAKWLPSENTSSAKTKELAKRVRKYLGLNSKIYRQMLTTLRRKIGLVETKMSNNKWKDIDYSKLTSKAGMLYKGAFAKHDGEGYAKYLEQVESGEKKINASTLFPYELVRQARSDNNKTIDLLWENLPDYTCNNEKAIVVADVSGSMSGTPMDVSVSLAMYFAERNEGIFKNKFITFSGNPSLQEIHGETLQQKIRNLQRADWQMNTNLQAVFDLVLNTAVANKVPENEMPKTIYIISDMEFDACARGGTNFENIKKDYVESGYEMPNLVFWNVNSRNDNVPVEKDQNGVMLVSGCSPTIFKVAVSKTTPIDYMMKILNSERYEPIDRALAKND